MESFEEESTGGLKLLVKFKISTRFHYSNHMTN